MDTDTPLTELTDTDLRAAIAYAGRVLVDGELYGRELSDYTIDQWKSWLSDLVAEKDAR